MQPERPQDTRDQGGLLGLHEGTEVVALGGAFEGIFLVVDTEAKLILKELGERLVAEIQYISAADEGILDDAHL